MKSKNSTSGSLIGPSIVILLALSLLSCGSKTANSSNETGTLKRGLNAADEAAAIRTLQTIFRAETQYMLSHAEEYGTLDQLVADNFLDQRFRGAAPVVEGYAFALRITPKSSDAGAAYTVNADPNSADGTPTGGARHLYLDSTSNLIHANASRPASANDPSLQ